MKMKRILITGAGGSPATNFVRSLRSAPENFFLVGTDCNKFYLQRAETDEKYLVPKAEEKDYLDILNYIIDKERLEFIHIQNDTEMLILSENREKLKTKTFLPKKETIRTCLNKFESHRKWKQAGLKQPETLLIKTEDDLKKAINNFNRVWIRSITGAGGEGSIATEDYEFSKVWLSFKKGWSRYTAAECLEPQSVTWQSIWKDGELVIAQSRKRLYWELSKLSPSGITGVTGGGVTINDPVVDEVAQKAIYSIDKNPNGIFSVDITYDKDKDPNPTEINIGRFFTTHEFFARAGLNMPYIFIKLAYNENIPKLDKKINPLQENLVWIRGVDFIPVLTDVKHIDDYEKKLGRIRNELQKSS